MARKYDSSRRSEQAQQTRARIVDAAREVFLAKGYAQATIREIAEAAGVSAQTVFNAFESKGALFNRVMEVAVVGDHAEVALMDREAFLALDEQRSPRRFVEAYVAAATAVLARLEPLHDTATGAAQADPVVGEAYRANVIHNRYDAVRGGARRLAATGALRAGVDADEAADVMWTVLSPDTYHALVGLRGWSHERFGAWAATVLHATVVRGTARRRSSCDG